MDWGLAKVLKEGGVADEERGQSPPAEVEVSVIRTVRSGSSRGRVAGRQRAGDPGVHGAGAGRRRHRAGRSAGRRVRPRLDPLRGPHRPAGLHRAEQQRGLPPGLARRHGRRLRPVGRLRGRRRPRRAGQRLPCPRARRPAARRGRGGRTDHGLPGRRAGEAAHGRARAGGGRGAGGRGTAAAQASGRAGRGGAGADDRRRPEHHVLPPAAAGPCRRGGPDPWRGHDPPRPGPRPCRRPGAVARGAGGDPSGRGCSSAPAPAATPRPGGNWTRCAEVQAGMRRGRARPPVTRSPGRHPQRQGRRPRRLGHRRGLRRRLQGGGDRPGGAAAGRGGGTDQGPPAGHGAGPGGGAGRLGGRAPAKAR